MFQPLLMFKTRALEDVFRKAMTGKKEVGGWLLASSWYDENIDHRTVKTLFGTFAWQISSWIVVPNESATPQNSWQSSNFTMARDLVSATCSSMKCSALFFHTHPTGSPNDPSEQDLKFTVQCCNIWRDAGESVIVQTAPLRVNYYRVEKNKSRRGHNWNISKGEFLSWRSPKMKQIVIW